MLIVNSVLGNAHHEKSVKEKIEQAIKKVDQNIRRKKYR